MLAHSPEMPLSTLPRAPAIASVLALVSTTPARADDEPDQPPVLESVLTESTTDVEADEAGEYELESNYSTVGERDGSTNATSIDLEIEYRLLSFVGARVEPSFSRAVYGSDAREKGFGISGGLALGLYHSPQGDAHLQLELSARHYTVESARAVQLGETVLPYEPQLLGAWRVGRVTLRGSGGFEFGPGTVAHAPIDLEAAILTGFDRDARFGFFGLETDVDLARTTPFMIAADVVASLTSLGLPLQIGFATPWFVGSPTHAANVGVLVRLFYVSTREAERGR